MIYTLTMNPAIDYIMSVPALARGEVNRSESQRFSIAGKGVNVSRELKNMGVDSVAVCLCGQGYTGERFTRLLHSHNLESVIIPVPDCDTRINVKICKKEEDGITEINGNFFADESAAGAVEKKLRELRKGDILIIGGSLPDGIPGDFYAKIACELSQKGVLVIADTSGDSLREIVKSSVPFMLKPNQQELGELFCVRIESFEDAIVYGRKTGCNALVSMGEKGAVFVTSDDAYVCYAPKQLKGYTVGAGDALLAGFTAEYIQSEDCEKALIAGVHSATDYIEGHIHGSAL